MAEKSFFSELRQRKVVQTAAVYIAVAWGATEILVTVAEKLFLPAWISTVVIIAFVVGFPVAMFLAWTFDVTSEGIQRTTIGSRRGKASIIISMLLLIAGTTGLFFLIRPSIVDPVEVIPNSIAVLPFENAGQDPNDSYLSEGLSDELRDQLGRVVGIRIAARTSSIAALDQGLDALAMSEKLGVANLVEGNLRRQGNILRISVQLIEGRTGLAIWSQTFERGPNELLNVQQSIAEMVVQHVLPDAEPMVAEPATRDVNANELMLLARHYEQQVRDRQVVDEKTLLEAVRHYRKATELDPESALAHSRLASTLLYLGDIDAAEAPIFKALSLNPNLSEVQNTLGEFYWVRGDPDAAKAYARAVELNPNNADALHNYASWAMATSKWKERDPEGMFKRALELDRLSLSRHAALGEFYGLFGQPGKTREVIRGIQELFDNAESFQLIAWLKELIGEVDEAIAWTIRARNLEPDNYDHVIHLADLYASIGDFETALQLEPNPGLSLLFLMRRYQDLIDDAEFLMIEEPEDMGVRYLLAFAYTATGQFESAIHVLSTTGLPDTVLKDTARSTSEIEAFATLFNALAGVGQPATDELAHSLAEWFDEPKWWGDISWIGLYRGCTLAILGRDEEALQELARVKQGSRLLREPVVRDSVCFQRLSDQPVYQGVLQDQEQRKREIRERLPATLAKFGLELN